MLQQNVITTFYLLALEDIEAFCSFDVLGDLANYDNETFDALITCKLCNFCLNEFANK